MNLRVHAHKYPVEFCRSGLTEEYSRDERKSRACSLPTRDSHIRVTSATSGFAGETRPVMRVHSALRFAAGYSQRTRFRCKPVHSSAYNSWAQLRPQRRWIWTGFTATRWYPKIFSPCCWRELVPQPWSRSKARRTDLFESPRRGPKWSYATRFRDKKAFAVRHSSGGQCRRSNASELRIPN